MLDSEFDKLLNDFFNAPIIKDSNRYKSYTPSTYIPYKLAIDMVDDKMEIVFLVVGHDPKNVEVSLTSDKIFIRAKTNPEDKSVFSQFMKNIDESLNIPVEFDGTTAKAEIKNGLLKIVIEKREEQKPKVIPINF